MLSNNPWNRPQLTTSIIENLKLLYNIKESSHLELQGSIRKWFSSIIALYFFHETTHINTAPSSSKAAQRSSEKRLLSVEERGFGLVVVFRFLHITISSGTGVVER